MMKTFLIAGMLMLLPYLVDAQQFSAAENTQAYLDLIKNKDIAVIANRASVAGRLNIVDTLIKCGISVEKIFSPEHGFRGYSEAGQNVKDSKDSLTGLPVISLYGKKNKIERGDLKGVDLVLFDLQDVGVRFFTYISTLSFAMEACAENNVPLIVLDRANPNIFYIDGPVLDSGYRSFVGMHPGVPVVYGMTIGEYAEMVNGEGWLPNGEVCDLQVIKLENYTHQTRMTELPVPPSPNLRNLNSIYLYPSLCFFEGTQVSVGRGTDYPFEVFGHPAMRGFVFSFTPVPMKGYSLNPPQNGQTCYGLDLRQFYTLHPKLMGRINLLWLFMAYRDLGSKPDFFNDYFDKLAGTGMLKKQILDNLSESEIRNSWIPGITGFKKIRSKYLLYPEY